MIVGSFWIGAKFAWYDMWIGAYWDRDRSMLFVCLLPMLVIWCKRFPKFGEGEFPLGAA